jgi:hypothetical protein
METWFELEYSYTRPGSKKIIYKGLKTCKTIEEVQKFAAVVYCLAKKDHGDYNSRDLEISKKYLGQGRFISLKKIFSYTKKEIKLNNF